MKILNINNFLCPDGGAESLQLFQASVCERKGHEVFFFATNKKPYFKENTAGEKYFPQYIQLKDLSSKNIMKITKIMYNFEAKKNLTQLIKDLKPDIAHIHCILYGLTVSVIDACYENNIPMVMSFHGPHFACPYSSLLIRGETYCEKELCISGNPIYGILNRCTRNSYLKSCFTAAELLFRKAKGYQNKIKKFICPSEAILNLAVRSGIDPNKLILINNFIPDDILSNQPSYNNKGYFLFVGRLSKVKGLDCLLKAITKVPKEIHFKIAGSSSDDEYFKNLAKELGLKNVEFLGFKTGKELKNEYRNCIATILPSNWFENFPMSILESFAYGKPVIGSNVGGIQEIINHEVNGLLFQRGNIEDLASCILKLYSSPELVFNYSKNAREKVEKVYNSEIFYNKLINVYNEAIRY